MKIAIITATYKRGDNQSPNIIKRAAESIMNQVHKDWKWFLIGDAYEDQEEFNTFSNLIPSEKLYTENLEVSIEREMYSPGLDRWHVSGITPVNVGIQRALEQGFDYVAFLDHDDIWYPDHLQLLSEAIETYKVPFLFTQGAYTTLERFFFPNLSNNYFKPQYANLNKNQRVLLNYGIPAYPTYCYWSLYIKSSVCLNAKVITSRMRDRLQEVGDGMPGDADWWMRIRDEQIKGNIGPSLFIEHPTVASIDEGYSKTKA